MKHSVRRTLLSLGVGVVTQRVLQLVAFVVIGRALGVAGLGVYAQGIALAAVLTVVAGAGVRNVVARAVAQHPGAARPLVVRAVRLRLVVGGALLAVACAAAFRTAQQPWFWVLCALHVVPAAFDLKNLVDAAGRTRREVLLETAVAALQLVLVGAWAAAHGGSLEALAAISLACRSVYALGAARTIARLRDDAPPPKTRRATGIAVGQTAHELLTIGDVALIAFACGDAAAGYYAVATRFAAAALLPSAQLSRLLLPHLLHADAAGDPRRTLATALRATLWLTVPVAAGGLVVADAVSALSGAAFAASGDALRLLLIAGVCQHAGWQLSHALLAAGRDRAYAHGLLWPAVAHALALLAIAASATAAPTAQATLAAALAAAAQAAYLAHGLVATRAHRDAARALPLTALAAAATAAAAALPAALPAQLTLGAVGFLAALWAFELRGRVRRVGDGLATASGFDGR